jgi:hypothetical protein
MSTVTYHIKTTIEEITIQNAPCCKCGGDFKFEQHWHKRKKTNEGVVATCKECGELFYSMNERTIIDKINTIYAGGRYHF